MFFPTQVGTPVGSTAFSNRFESSVNPASTGTYLVSVTLVADSGVFQITLNCTPVGPDIPGSASGPATVTRILSVTGGSPITIVNNSGASRTLSAGTEIRIFRIA